MKVNENASLEVFRASSDKYEYLVTEVCYDGEPIFRINQDDGKDALKVEMLIEYCESEFTIKIPLEDLVKSLQLAKTRITDSIQKESVSNDIVEVILLNDKEYSYVTSIIKFQKYTVAQINQEKGIDNLEIELFLIANRSDINFLLPVNNLFSILEKAKNKLLRCASQSFIEF